MNKCEKLLRILFYQFMNKNDQKFCLQKDMENNFYTLETFGVKFGYFMSKIFSVQSLISIAVALHLLSYRSTYRNTI